MIVGASFIGLEVASSLRARDIDVHVVGPEAIPMARVLGPQLGSFIRSVHEQHGVTFHLGRTAASIDEHSVTLDSGERDRRRPRRRRHRCPSGDRAGQTGRARSSTGSPGRRVPRNQRTPRVRGRRHRPLAGPHSGEAIRVEHFVVAERQGQTAARNMLGRREPFDAVPFFWTEQHDLSIAYVGHAEKWDEVVIDGSIEARDCSISLSAQGRKHAVAVIHRDHEGLCAEVEFERAIGRPNDRSAARQLSEVAVSHHPLDHRFERQAQARL